jgi:hypothetical protein
MGEEVGGHNAFMTRKPVLLFPIVFALAACGGSSDESAAPEGDVAGTVAERTTPTCTAGTTRRLRSSSLAYAAVVRRPTDAYRQPGDQAFASFRVRNVNDVPTVLGVLSSVVDGRCRAAWYRVQLPRKPNGVVGYVRARDVELFPVRTRIEIDLSERRVTLFRSGRRVLETTGAIGSGATPTPTGSYYVDQRLIPYDTSGPFGPGAIGIAAYSEVLTGWAQGGPIAIHGTNKPWTVGKAVSNGCIRVRNPVLRRLFAAALPGTPVTIRT